MSDDEFLNHILKILAKASVGQLTVRVQIPPDMNKTSFEYRIATGINVLLSDLETQQESRVRKLAEEAIAQSEEIKAIVSETQDLINEMKNGRN